MVHTCLGAGGLKVLVGGVFISVHLHVGYMTFLGASCLINFDKSLQNISMIIYTGIIIDPIVLAQGCKGMYNAILWPFWS